MREVRVAWERARDRVTAGHSTALRALIWVIVFFMFAFTALAKGHWVMFIIGFFLPIFWIIGALIEPTARAEGAR